MKDTLLGFERHDLDDDHIVWVGHLPDNLVPDAAAFEALWQTHPAEYHEIKMYGRLVKTPRWQQAYGKDYRYTGRVNKAEPIPALLEPLLSWSQENIDQNLNGLLLNWYDGLLGHYIGPHSDSIVHLVPATPIVTISLGDKRFFRLRRGPAKLKAPPIDFPVRNGSVIVLPWKTNLAFTHEVPHHVRQLRRRISVTLRGFINQTTN